jgi:hypothetical protein
MGRQRGEGSGFGELQGRERAGRGRPGGAGARPGASRPPGNGGGSTPEESEGGEPKLRWMPGGGRSPPGETESRWGSTDSCRWMCHSGRGIEGWGSWSGLFNVECTD